MTDTRSDQYNIESLWLKEFGGRYAIGCGDCTQSIDYQTNTITQHCQNPIPDTDLCGRERADLREKRLRAEMLENNSAAAAAAATATAVKNNI